MPLPNRVDPFGNIQSVAARGLMFGNRGGCMHTPDQQLKRRPWTNERWICCVLEFKGRRRKLMQPGLYTELFFLDEATAFSAGHRPCLECRRADGKRFIEAWSKAHLPPGQPLKTISHVDRIAHRERIDARSHAQRTARVQLSTLPDGVLITRDAEPAQPLLLWKGKLSRWSFDGYSDPAPLPHEEAVTLLTPQSFAIAFSAGYTPAVHPTADR